MIRRLSWLTMVMALGVTLLLAKACGRPANAAPPPHLLSEAPWAGNVRVNDDTGSANHQSSPSIAVDPEGNAYAVWMDRRSGYDDIYFAYRPAGGSWGTNVRVSDDTGTDGQDRPCIAVDPEGDAYAVWMDFRNGISNPDIYFSYRPSGGSWSANIRVNDDEGTCGQYDPSIAVDPSGNAYALWTDNRNGGYWLHPDIYFSYRPAGGDWGTNVKVDDDATGADQGGCSIAVDASGNAYALWSDDRNGDWNSDVYFSYRPAGGSWETNVRVDDDPGTGGTGSTSIAVDATGNAYAVWEDSRGGSTNLDIYFSYRPSGGSWGANVRVDDDPGTGSQDWPSIAVDPTGNAYAVWEDERILADSDIYLSYRPAAGAWGASVRLNDDVGTPNEQRDPSIAVDPSGSAFAVWFDVRNEWDPDIYFCSNWWAFKVYVPLTMRKHQ